MGIVALETPGIDADNEGGDVVLGKIKSDMQILQGSNNDLEARQLVVDGAAAQVTADAAQVATDKVIAVAAKDEAVATKLVASGVATNGSATTLTDTGAVMGADAHKNYLIKVYRAEVLIRSEKINSNTGTVWTVPTGAAMAADDIYEVYSIGQQSLSSVLAVLGDGGFVGNVNDPLVHVPFKRANDELRLSGVQTSTRSTVGYYWDAYSGLLASAAIDEPRFERMADGGVGMLVEAIGTNSLAATNWRTAASWAAWGAPTSTAVADHEGIDGVANKAITITDTDATGLSARTSTIAAITSSTNTHCGSIFVAKNAANIVQTQVILAGGTQVNAATKIDTATGLKSADSNPDSYVEDYWLWWRVVMPATDNGSGNTTARIVVVPAVRATLDGPADITLQTSAVFDWPQIELNQSFASSPIAAGLTRDADVVDLPRAGNLPAAASPHTIMADFDRSGSKTGFSQYVFTVYGEVGHSIIAGVGNDIFTVKNGASMAQVAPAIVNRAANRCALIYNGTSLTAVLNGVKGVPVANSGATGTASSIGIGYNFSGHIRNLRIYDKALTDAEIEAA